MIDTLRIQRAVDSVAEACCLAAVVCLPLYFSGLTDTGYEPDKAALLRVLAVVAAGAWLIGALTRPRPRGAARGDPLLWLAAAGFLVFGLATLFSIDPRLSLWGSHARQEGLVTRAAYLVCFLIVATRLRREDQARRLVTAIILGSVPAVAYGILQQLGLDPVPSSGDPSTSQWPVRSSFGQHIYFGSYLVMVIPFTAARALEERGPRTENGRAPARWHQATEWGLVCLAAAVYLAFIALAVHRPALFALLPGLLAGLVVSGLVIDGTETAVAWARSAGYAVLLALQILALFFTGARGSWLAFFASVPVFAWLLASRMQRPRIARAILLLTVLGAVFLLLLNLPGGPLQPLRSIPGLSRLANITDSGGAGGSAEGRLYIWQGVGRLMTHDPSVGNTWGGVGRDLVGYGPESLHWAFQAVYPLQLRQLTSEIWTWDRAHNIYLDYLVDAGILGLLSYLAVLVLYVRRALRGFAGEARTGWIPIAGLSALAAHLVDGVFGIEGAATLLLLWVIVGQGAALPFLPAENRAVPLSATAIRAAAGLLAALILAAGGLLLLPSSDAHPDLYAAVSIVALAASLAAAALLLATRDGIPFSLPSRAVPGHNVYLGLAIALAAAVALSGETRFHSAAIADRAGDDRLAAGQIVSALGYLESAARANPYDPQYETDLGGAYLSLGAGHLDSSEPAFQPTPPDARTLDPARADGLGNAQLLQLSRYSLEAARSLSPLDPDAYDNLGNLYLQSNDVSQALAAYAQAESLSLDNPRYLDRMALAQLQNGQVRAAEASARRALGLDTTYWYSHYALSLIDHRAGSHQSARQEATVALATVHNYWPPPPSPEVAELRSLERSG